MNLLKWQMHLEGLTLYESRDERTNGHDLEITVKQRDGWFTYWIQSKILYHSIRRKKMIRLDDGVYRQFPHRVGRHNQIDILLRRARAKKVIPLYLLYNFVSAPIPGPLPLFCPLRIERSQYGCSIIGAHVLKEQFSDDAGKLQNNVRFSELHPELALPWLVLVCWLPQYTLTKMRDLFQLPKNHIIRPSEEEPDTNQRQWVLLTRYASSERSYRVSSQKVIGFSPRYRMVIDTQQNG
jgi:hypothetical protein